MLQEEAIDEFKEIYQKLFGEKITNSEATRRANNLMRYYRAVLKPVFDTKKNIQDNAK